MIRLQPGRLSRGLSLVECLIFVGIWITVAGTTVMSLKQSAMSRSQMAMRAELAAIAQSELERTRALPAAELVPGTQSRTEDQWPAGTSCTVTMTRRSPATWEMDVLVERKMVRPIQPVRLTSLRRAAP